MFYCRISTLGALKFVITLVKMTRDEKNTPK